MNKSLNNLTEAVEPITDGATIMIGGFGGSGAPIELIHALIDTGTKNLTIINNNAGNGHVGLAAMIEHGMVAKMICSFPRSADPRIFTELYLSGGIELELVPQGTLAWSITSRILSEWRLKAYCSSSIRETECRLATISGYDRPMLQTGRLGTQSTAKECDPTGRPAMNDRRAPGQSIPATSWGSKW